jgi:hypothetical protein
VIEACCGHGNTSKAYVFLEDGTLFRGVRRIEKHDLKRGAEKRAARRCATTSADGTGRCVLKARHKGEHVFEVVPA